MNGFGMPRKYSRGLLELARGRRLEIKQLPFLFDLGHFFARLRESIVST